MATAVAAAAGARKPSRLAPEVNRILFIKNLPLKITSDELYELFGQYGAIRQIRLGNKSETKGTAFVVYEDIFDAKTAQEHLNGFKVMDRFVVCLYHRQERMKKMDVEKKKAEIAQAKAIYGVSGTGQ
eukprot:TRINITY_DN13948_c0_g1_i1.p1 TRINITY_DN13948_c0_g1~~TRINITY_DN13948_c0_g1_i1.p1  ORF type:complete len:128 (-),score=33.73 TRINITY_DN13948_c0_g1_i1:94-477(-)